MRRSMIGGIALLGLALVPGLVWADDSSSPGKNSASASVSGLDVQAGTDVPVQIEKGKKKRMLVVNGVVSAPSTGTIGISCSVNGVSLEPGTVSQKCEGAACSVAGTWWLDLDTGELANPGVFIGLPLNILLEPTANAAAVGKASVTATMVKK